MDDEDDEDQGRITITISSDKHASPFLREKLSAFKVIQKTPNYLGVWFADEVVIKRYGDKPRFERAVLMQERLFATNPLITCELLDTWANDDEWFTVSKSGGLSGDEISYMYADEMERKMAATRMELWNIGLVLFDDHWGNYVIDSDGICRVIDYESIEDVSILQPK
jgi:hypothetical protein